MDKEFQKLRDYSYNLLARKGYSCWEMRRKLTIYAKKRDITGEKIDLLMTKLQEMKYLDDQKFARDFVDSRVRNKPRGKRMLVRELKMKGIDMKFINDALESIELDEGRMALGLLEKRSRQWVNVPMQKQREKAFRYLTSRGFNMETVYKTVNQCYDRSAIE